MNKIQSYIVWSLNVWGHCDVDCKHHGCDCVGEDGEHNDEACECFFDINNRFQSGKISVGAIEKTHNVGMFNEFSSLDISDKSIVKALVRQGFLKETVTVSDIKIDDNGFVMCAKTNMPVYYIEGLES